jgi:hypothetical protein
MTISTVKSYSPWKKMMESDAGDQNYVLIVGMVLGVRHVSGSVRSMMMIEKRPEVQRRRRRDNQALGNALIIH